MKKQFLRSFLIVVVLLGCEAYPAYAQTKPLPVAMQSSAVSGQDSLELNVLLTVLDSTGQAIPKEAMRFEGESSIYGSGFRGAPVEVTEATTPVRIALVIDASGSMQQEIQVCGMPRSS